MVTTATEFPTTGTVLLQKGPPPVVVSDAYSTTEDALLSIAAILLLASVSYFAMNFLADQLESGLRRVFVSARKRTHSPRIRR